MTDEIVTPEEKPKRAPRGAAKAVDDKPRDIISIIPLIREELGAIAKDQTPEVGQKFAYRGHDQIVNAIAPLFNKYGVFTTVEDTLLDYSGRNAGNKYATASVIAEKVTFYAPDGTYVSSTVVAESVDYGNKATGQAGTYAYRIALTKTFTIPTGEADPDSRNEEFEATSVPAAPAAAAQPSAPAGDAIKELKGRVAELFAARDVPKGEIQERGTKFFNNRQGWDENVAALTKLVKALEDGEEI